MKFHGRKLSTALCVALLAIACTRLASAQLSTSVGDSLTLPLDYNLDGLNSAVAPTTSSAIEPGATNLMTPDEHQLPFDAIGASIVATPLNPSVTQLFTVSRVPFQLDSSIKDSTLLTGQHPRMPIEIVESVTRKTNGMGFSSDSLKTAASSFGRSLPTLTLSLSPLSGTQPGATGVPSPIIYPQSSWRAGAGGVSSVLASNPAQIVGHTRQPSSLSENSDVSGATIHRDTTQENASVNTSSLLSTAPSVDTRINTSRSPLETVTSLNPDSSSKLADPFGSFGEKSFLNPDITLSTLHRNSTKGTRTSGNARSAFASSTQTRSQFSTLGQSEFARSRSGINGTNLSTRESAITGAESRRMQSFSEQQAKRPKWHNPILQQMEDAKSTGNR
ncbi:hypothetical protein H7849_07825 [Alloacidobacterium dinghuense]|uniref:Uncharacterized protein n=1 Tax=Alloacidobacterium dinghuense TaxID=2763107 RepID=A0A7G8BMP4_9BACT|nr:hypothetical protein [Alloacidobacterium dinghuense]QNI33814.1 hypothetical protein H7849_07825 [Alloacidobacterium dinghuense]